MRVQIRGIRSRLRSGQTSRLEYSLSGWTSQPVLGFLPSVITPLVAQAYGANDMDGVQRHIGEALFLSLVIGLLGCALVTLQYPRLLGIVIPADAPAMVFAVPYFLCRGISFLPAMLSTVGFATFRGTMDTVTPLAVSAVSNIFHIVLLPLLIFNAGLGVDHYTQRLACRIHRLAVVRSVHCSL